MPFRSYLKCNNKKYFLLLHFIYNTKTHCVIINILLLKISNLLFMLKPAFYSLLKNTLSFCSQVCHGVYSFVEITAEDDKIVVTSEKNYTNATDTDLEDRLKAALAEKTKSEFPCEVTPCDDILKDTDLDIIMGTARECETFNKTIPDFAEGIKNLVVKPESEGDCVAVYDFAKQNVNKYSSEASKSIGKCLEAASAFCCQQLKTCVSQETLRDFTWEFWATKFLG